MAKADIAGIEEQIERLREMSQQHDLDVDEEIRSLEGKLERMREEAYSGLTPVERVQLARHPQRPYTLDYVEHVFDDFIELRGDRAYRDDASIVGGWARLDGRSVMVIGHQKGRDMKENLARNFGMPHPEGYRKALRLMLLAAKFGKPVITLLDTPGAFPGMEAEERGQAEAIARNLREMARLRVPILAIVIGEGGSGGALALGVADRVLMLENAVYSVISPEGCAAILWKSPDARDQAAEALRLTATDLQKLGVIDDIVPEPMGGAQEDVDAAYTAMGDALRRHLTEVAAMDEQERRRARWDKFGRMGEWRDSA